MVSRQRAESGYTLVELMIVVAIIGVLATLATYGVRKYILAAKTSEGIEMLRGIKEAEELYKHETFRYMATSLTPVSYFPWNDGLPKDGKKKYFECADCPAQAAWKELNVSTNQPVQFAYVVITGVAGAVPAQHPDWKSSPAAGFPATPGDIWYVAYAAADLNGDGKALVYAGTSFSTEILSNAGD